MKIDRSPFCDPRCGQYAGTFVLFFLGHSMGVKLRTNKTQTQNRNIGPPSGLGYDTVERRYKRYSRDLGNKSLVTKNSKGTVESDYITLLRMNIHVRLNISTESHSGWSKEPVLYSSFPLTVEHSVRSSSYVSSMGNSIENWFERLLKAFETTV